MPEFLLQPSPNSTTASRFFEKAGVKRKSKRGGAMLSQEAAGVGHRDRPVGHCFENGVKIIYNTRVTEIMTLGSKVFGVAISISGAL